MNKLLLILTFLINFLGRIIYSITQIDRLYFISDSLSWFIIALYILRKTKNKQLYDFWENQLAFGFLLVITNNFLDETFFDPLRFGINEYVLLITILLRFIYVRWKKIPHH